MLPSVTRHQRTSFSTRAKFTFPPPLAVTFVLDPGQSLSRLWLISHVMVVSLSVHVRSRRRHPHNCTDLEGSTITLPKSSAGKVSDRFWGHEEALPPPTLSNRSQLGKPTFAERRGNGRGAP